MRLDLFFDVNGQRPFVSAKMRTRALDTVLEGSGTRSIPLPSGDKCIIITNQTLAELSVQAFVPLLTEDGQPILTEDGVPLLVEESGGALQIEAGGFAILPGREQHRSIDVSIAIDGLARVTVLQ